MHRMVQVVNRNGHTHTVPMTAEQVAFYLRLADFRVEIDPTASFEEVIVDLVKNREKELDTARQN